MTVNLSSLGWDDDFAAAYRRFDRPDQRPARVTRVDRGVCTALTARGPQRASLGGAVLDGAAHDPIALPCAGDWVALRDWPDERTTVEGVLPRRTAVVRATSGKEATGQVVAANIDSAAVVEPLEPEPDLGRVERLLALAWGCGAAPLIVLTKADLLTDAAAVGRSVSAVAPGVPVYVVSTRTGVGLEPLRALVTPGCTLGLLGPSGAGKSSLVNALVGAPVMGTQELRADGRGRHTTTYRALVPVPGGGAVLDTPGLRQVGMYDATAGLDLAFDDVAALAARCRFVGCSHVSEPDCAVVAALATGELAPRRLASWRKLQRELAYALRRRDAREAAAWRQRWRRLSRERRARP
jgi:ribosome biogenesis GTPase / thiamine phosphate phosphatase